jgi:hypothetical protein
MVPIPDPTVIVEIPLPRKSKIVAPNPIFTPSLLIPIPETRLERLVPSTRIFFAERTPVIFVSPTTYKEYP